MHTIALISQKGGAGKTTLAVHIAAELAAAGRKTLLMDLDPQGSAALWGDNRGDNPPDVATEHSSRLDHALKVARSQGYQVVVLDTAPHGDQAALHAAKVANTILIPCRPATFDIGALRGTLEICDIAKKPAVVVLNAAPVRSRIVNEAQAEIIRAGGKVSLVIIRQRVAFQHCLIDGRVAAEFEPGGSAAQEIAALCKYECLNVSIHEAMTA